MSSEAIDSQDGLAPRVPTYQPMVLVASFFMIGILADRWLDFGWNVALCISLAGLLGWVLIGGCGSQSTRTGDLSNSRWMFASVMLLIGLIGAGAFWHHGRWNWVGQYEISRYARADSIPCCVEAKIVCEPKLGIAESGFEDSENVKYKTTLAAKALRIRDGNEWRPASGRVDIVVHAQTNHVRSGDRVRVFGSLVSTSPPTNPGQFDFQAFYRGKSKLAFVHAYHAESVEVISNSTYSGSGLLASLRYRLNAITWEYVGDDEAPFASAIMLGNREQLSKERRQGFLETGTAHLLAISGLHVGILAGAFFMLFRLGCLSRKHCLVITIVFVFFYAWLVEFRPPALRAAILISLFCYGRLKGEKSFSFNLLAIAALVVLALNPSDLFGLGPQLSFLAVASLTFGRNWVFWPPSRDPIKRLIAGTRPFHVRVVYWLGRKSRTAILVSGLIWLIAMPLIASQFHLFSPIALLINPILLLPIAWGLYGGLGALVFGWLLPPAARFCGWICDRNLALIEWLISSVQSVPYSHVWTSGPPLWSLVTFYVGMFLFAVFPPTKQSGRSLALLVLGWMLLSWIGPDLIGQALRDPSNSPLECTFIDVGHGTSVLLQFPDGKNLLYDAGSFGAAEYGARNIAGTLWHERIERLDAVILSHADVDHFNALPILMEQFGVGMVYVSPMMLESDSDAVKDLFAKLNFHSIPVQTLVAGKQLKFGATTTTVLGPPPEGTGANDNSDSVVLLIEHLQRRVLLPGDLEQAGLFRLLGSEPIDCDLAMAPHHGSPNSDPLQFLDWANPEYVVISAGSHRLKPEVVEQFHHDSDGEKRIIGRTDRDGAVKFRIDPQGKMSIQSWATQPW